MDLYDSISRKLNKSASFAYGPRKSSEEMVNLGHRHETLPPFSLIPPDQLCIRTNVEWTDALELVFVAGAMSALPQLLAGHMILGQNILDWVLNNYVP